MSRFLVTYFGPFKHFQDNPAELVGRKLEELHLNSEKINFKKLDVTFDCIDQFVETELENFDLVLQLGVASKSEKIRLELIGKNEVKGTDNSGIYREGIIDEKISLKLYTLFDNLKLESLLKKYPNEVVLSENAGAYLCNYLYFKSIKKGLNKQIVFIHLANFQDLPLAVSYEKQVEIINLLIEGLG